MFDANKAKMNPVDENSNVDLLEEESLSMEGYDKPVRKARNILFAIAAIQLIDIYLALEQYGMARTITFILSIGLALIFFLLGLWTKRKPYDAIITGIVVYSILIVGNAVFEPATILQGLILNIVIFALLVTALSNAKEAQSWKDSLKK